MSNGESARIRDITKALGSRSGPVRSRLCGFAIHSTAVNGAEQYEGAVNIP